MNPYGKEDLRSIQYLPGRGELQPEIPVGSVKKIFVQHPDISRGFRSEHGCTARHEVLYDELLPYDIGIQESALSGQRASPKANGTSRSVNEPGRMQEQIGFRKLLQHRSHCVQSTRIPDIVLMQDTGIVSSGLLQADVHALSPVARMRQTKNLQWQPTGIVLRNPDRIIR